MIKLLPQEHEPPVPALFCDVCDERIENANEAWVIFALPIELLGEGRNFRVETNKLGEFIHTHGGQKCSPLGEDRLMARCGEGYALGVWPLVHHFYLLLSYAGVSDKELRNVIKDKDVIKSLYSQ